MYDEVKKTNTHNRVFMSCTSVVVPQHSTHRKSIKFLKPHFEVAMTFLKNIHFIPTNIIKVTVKLLIPFCRILTLKINRIKIIIGNAHQPIKIITD